MTITLEELKEKLKQVEETQLIDMLGLDSEKIVEAFTDVIEERFDKLEGELE